MCEVGSGRRVLCSQVRKGGDDVVREIDQGDKTPFESLVRIVTTVHFQYAHVQLKYSSRGCAQIS